MNVKPKPNTDGAAPLPPVGGGVNGWGLRSGLSTPNPPNAQGASHFEPTGLGDNSEVPAAALFLSCHVKGEHCDKVYAHEGTSGWAICDQITEDKVAECRVNHPGGAGSSAPP